MSTLTLGKYTLHTPDGILKARFLSGTYQLQKHVLVLLYDVYVRSL